MLRIDFFEAQTPADIIDQTRAVCEEVAACNGLQLVISRQTLDPKQNAGDHNDRYLSVDYYHKEKSHAGRIFIFGPEVPIEGFHGFNTDFRLVEDPDNKQGIINVQPLYHYVDVTLPSEHQPAVFDQDPHPKIVEMTHEALEEHFVARFPRLFKVSGMWSIGSTCVKEIPTSFKGDNRDHSSTPIPGLYDSVKRVGVGRFLPKALLP